MIDISIKLNVDQITKRLNRLAYQQVPYVEMRTVNELAKLAQAAEKAAMPKIFDRPTPFTVNSISVQAARKGLPISRVYVKDIAAKYLKPFEDGGTHFLAGSRKYLWSPVKRNKYGNMPRNFTKTKAARADVFVGKKTIKGREVNGMWQRTADHKLKLLVEFKQNKPVRQRLQFGDRAKTVVVANINKVFGREMAKALAK